MVLHRPRGVRGITAPEVHREKSQTIHPSSHLADQLEKLRRRKSGGGGGGGGGKGAARPAPII